MNRMYPDRTFPDWVVEALASVNIFLYETQYSNGKENILSELNQKAIWVLVIVVLQKWNNKENTGLTAVNKFTSRENPFLV